VHPLLLDVNLHGINRYTSGGSVRGRILGIRRGFRLVGLHLERRHYLPEDPSIQESNSSISAAGSTLEPGSTLSCMLGTLPTSVTAASFDDTRSGPREMRRLKPNALMLGTCPAMRRNQRYQHLLGVPPSRLADVTADRELIQAAHALGRDRDRFEPELPVDPRLRANTTVGSTQRCKPSRSSAGGPCCRSQQFLNNSSLPLSKPKIHRSISSRVGHPSLQLES